VFPLGRAALSVTRPSGSLSTSTFSPGSIPINTHMPQHILLNVTWPRAVNGQGSHCVYLILRFTVMQFYITWKQGAACRRRDAARNDSIHFCMNLSQRRLA
jgi:hypothetical protein